MMMEIMGLHLPGTAFVNPGTPLREALTRRCPSGCTYCRPGREFHPGWPHD
jgi:phosphogluconate dehydratase